MAMVEITKGNLFVVSGPSGVGKSTICNEVVKRMDNVHLSVSATTRTKGNGEIDGVNYFYLSHEEFENKIKNEELLEYAEVFGNYYGTPAVPVMKSIDEGKSIILEIDVQGGMQVKQAYDDVVLIFVLASRPSEIQKRLAGRARGEDAEAEQNRIKLAGQEIATAWQNYDYMVINDDLEQAVEKIVSIIKTNSGDNE